MRDLVERKALGNKTGSGFYKKAKAADGIDRVSGSITTRPATTSHRIRCVLTWSARCAKLEDLGERLRAIFAQGAGDRAGDYIINTTLPILAYAARRVPEIADSVADVDNAMRWGFGTDIGPFEMWDTAGCSRRPRSEWGRRASPSRHG